MSEAVDHYYLRKPNLPPNTRTSRFIGCHLRFKNQNSSYPDTPIAIWVLESGGNEQYMPLSSFANNYDSWLISDLLQGHMKKVTPNQYVNARIRAMKGAK